MADPSADTSSSSSSWSGRRIAKWIGGIVGGLVVLVLAVALILPQFFTSAQLKGYVIPPMEEATGRQVQIDEIGLRVLWTPAVQVSGFQLANREGFGSEPAVEAGELNVEVALWPLFSGSIQPTAIELVDPVIRYQIAEDGSTNYDDMMAAPDTAAAEEEEGGGLAIPVSNFRTTGAQIRYQDRSTGQALELDFGARLNALPDGDAITSAGTIDIAALRAVLPDVKEDTMEVTNATVEYDVRAALSKGTINVSSLTMTTAPITLRTTGSVRRLNTRPTLDLTVETTEADLATLAEFAPAAAVEGLNPRGTVALKTAIRGPLPDSTGATDSLSVDGTGSLAGIGVDYQGRSLLQDLNADLALSLESASLQSIEGTLLGAALSGSVSVDDLMGTPRLDLSLETGDMNLSDLTAFAPPEQVEGYNPQGTVRITAAVSGPIPEGTDALDQLSVDGGGRLSGFGVDYEGTEALRDLGADLTFSTSSASIQSIDGALFGKPVKGDVTIQDPMGTPRVDGRLAGTADLKQLDDLSAKLSEAEPMGVSGTADYDVAFAGPIDNPDAIRPNGRIQLAELRYPYESFRHPIEIPNATVELTGTGLSMDQFTMTTGEQSMQLETTIRNLFPVSEAMAETDPAMAVDFSFSSDRLNLVTLYPEEEQTDTSSVYYSQLFAATLSGSKVNGQSPKAVAEKMYGDTELPGYTVDGRVEIGTFLNDPQRIDDLAFDVGMKDRRLEVRNLGGTMYEGQLAGSITFDQSGSASAAAPNQSASVLMASRATAAAPRSVPPSSDLNYDIKLKDARTGAFLEDWTTLGKIVTGTLTLDMDGKTPLTEGFLPVKDALTAKGTSIVLDGGLADDFGVAKAIVGRLGFDSASFTQFKKLGGNLAIENGAVQIDSWDLGNRLSDGQVSGALGLGGSVDLTMRMDLPVSTLQKSKIFNLAGVGSSALSAIQKLTGSGNGDETIPVKVNIGGTMRNPSVQLVDKNAIKSAVQSLVKKQGIDRVRNLFDGGGEK